MASSRIPLRTRLERLSTPEPNTGCWLWTSTTTNRGYGRLSIDGGDVLAHRAAYEAFCGAIPAGLMVCHRCDVRSCINPEHLFLGCAQDNQADKARKSRGNKSHKGLPFGAALVRPNLKRPFQARVTFQGRKRCGGYFSTAEEASTAALALKAKLLGIQYSE